MRAIINCNLKPTVDESELTVVIRGAPKRLREVEGSEPSYFITNNGAAFELSTGSTFNARPLFPTEAGHFAGLSADTIGKICTITAQCNDNGEYLHATPGAVLRALEWQPEGVCRTVEWGFDGPGQSEGFPMQLQVELTTG
jgi:hypothetical protein